MHREAVRPYYSGSPRDIRQSVRSERTTNGFETWCDQEGAKGLQ